MRASVKATQHRFDGGSSFFTFRALVLCVVVALLLPTPAHAATPARDYAYDVSGRLWRVMDSDGALVSYTYDAVGNITKISRDKVDPNFNILGTLPITGGAGDLVTIQGHGFDPDLVGNTVTIGGVAATVVSVDANGRKLVVKVPWGAETGPISVTATGQTTVAPDPFTVVHYGDAGIAGSLTPGATASYPLELTQGQTVLIRLADKAHNGFYPNVALNDSSGKLLTSAYSAAVAGITYTATASGSYAIVVSDASGQNVNADYVLYYTVAPGSNEGGALDPNAAIDGVIDLGDMDSFTFDATAGVTAHLRVAEIGTTGLYPYVLIYDPSGKLVTSNYGAAVAAVSVTPTVTGTYTAVVMDGSSGSASTGTYKIYYTRVPGSNDGGVLNPNAPLDGVIDLGDMDAFTFDLTAGASAHLRVAEIGATGFYPYVLVYDPSGKLITSNYSATVAAVSLTPTVSGTYTAVVTDASSGSASTGTYKIYYTRVPGSNDGGALNPNAPIDGTIDLGDMDSFTFNVTAGATAHLRVAEVGATGFYPYVLVYDPNGTLVTSNFSASVAAVSLTPSVSGTYTAVVTDASSGSAATGTYKIYYTLAPGSTDGGVLDPNAPLDGTIDLGDFDAYTFDANAGATIHLRVAEIGQTGFYPYVLVYDPSGALVTSNYSASVAAVSLTPTVTGTYTVVVTDASSGSAATGAYKIYYTRVPGSNDGGALNPNAPLDGTIDLGDLDAYTFDVTAGAGVQLRVAEIGQSGFYPYLLVYDPSGKLVASNFSANVAAVSLAAAVSGTYTAVVTDASSGAASTGTYKIYYAKAPGSNNGGALNPNAPLDGAIDLGGLDAYTFDVTAGAGIQLRVTDVAQTSFYPYIQVYDPNGKLVVQAGGSDVAATSFSPAVSGTYTAIVFDDSSGYASTGTYKIYYTRTGGSNDGVLDPNAPIAATIDLGDLDAYTFDLSAGMGVQLRVTDVGQTSFYPYLQVYDPNGTLLVQAGGYDVAATSFSAAVAGTYTAVVFDDSSGYASTGSYKIYYARAPGSNDGGVLDPNVPLDGTIDLGDLDAFTFDVTAGVSVLLRVADLGHTAFYPYLQVYDPTGKLVVQAGGADVAALSLTPSVAGTYTAIVFDDSSGYASSGNYKIYYSRAPGSNDGGLLTPSVAVTGTIDLGDIDNFTLSAKAGDKFKLVVTDVNATAFYPAVSVAGPTGTLITTATGQDTATATFTAATAGTYTVAVFDNSSGFVSSGGYSLLLTPN
jgi:hypothetical protein